LAICDIVALGPHGERRAVLVEDRPEHHDHAEDRQQRADAIAVLALGFAPQRDVEPDDRDACEQERVVAVRAEHRGLGPEQRRHAEPPQQAERGGGPEHAPEDPADRLVTGLGRLHDVRLGGVLAAGDEPRDAQEHPDAGGHERRPPADLVARDRGDEVAHEGTDVDAHVEDVEAGLLERTEALLLVVEVADQRRDVRLEEAVADDDEQQREPERDAVPGDRQAAVAEAHQDAAEDDRPAVTDDAVGEQPADEGRQVDQRQIRAEDVRGVAVRHRQAAHRRIGRIGRIRHVQDEDAEHQVEAEPLPHLGEEQDRQASGMVLEHRGVSGIGRRSRGCSH
jgi:hypothetical protein